MANRTTRRRVGGWAAGLAWLLASGATAAVPEPSHIFYGAVSSPAGSLPEATVSLHPGDCTTAVLASAEIGGFDDAPDFYVLTVDVEQPLSPGERNDGVAQAGDAGTLCVTAPGGGPIPAAAANIGGRGLAVRMDLFVDTVTGLPTDGDADGVPDYADNCRLPNGGQADADGNGIGDACEGLVNPGLHFNEVADLENPGDPASPGGQRGVVTYLYEITDVEVTNADYLEMLAAVAADDPNGLYSELMASDPRGGIVRSGAPGAYAYAVKPAMADKPVNFVTWLDAARFANWVENGRPEGVQEPGTTETGAFDLTVGDPGVFAAIDEDAEHSLPTEDEWYKAAYYDPTRGGSGYWAYPTRGDALPIAALANGVGDVLNAGPEVANHASGAEWGGQVGHVTTVSSAGNTSHYGTADQGGNVREWLADAAEDDAIGTSSRLARGGSYADAAVELSATADSPDRDAIRFAPGEETAETGFRLVRSDPSDEDVDGVPDGSDNCTTVPNGPDAGPNDQLDGDGDGYGDACDCDFNDDGACNLADFSFFLSDLQTGVPSTPGTDMDGNGTVNLGDFSLFVGGLQSGSPGPSALASP